MSAYYVVVEYEPFIVDKCINLIQCLFMLPNTMNDLIFVIYTSYIYSLCYSSPYLLVKQMCQIGNMEGFVLVENYMCAVA